MEDQSEPPKSCTITQQQSTKVYKWVCTFLPSEYDREFIADTIIINSWTNDITHISREYVRKKCISAWRTMQSERQKNERSLTMPQERRNEEDNVDRKILVEEAVMGCLTSFERKLIWMRFWDNETLEEMSRNISIRRDEIQKALKIALYKMRIHLT